MRLSKLLIGILLFIGSATYAQHSPQDTLTAYYYRYPQQAIKDAEALYRQATLDEMKESYQNHIDQIIDFKNYFYVSDRSRGLSGNIKRSRKIPFPGDGFCRYSCHKFLLCPAICRVLQ